MTPHSNIYDAIFNLMPCLFVARRTHGACVNTPNVARRTHGACVNTPQYYDNLNPIYDVEREANHERDHIDYS